MRQNSSITDVPGIKVGHLQNQQVLTGCTVILCEEGAVAGISQRGGAPGTRETDLLKPMRLVEKVHAVLLSGGSAFGLDAAAGVMQYLEERSFGFSTSHAKVPIVPAAILYDLALGDPKVRPDKKMGYTACTHATSEKPQEGNFGAGIGATVGNIFGIRQAMKGGIGTSSRKIGAGVSIGAIVAVNPFGDVVDYHDRRILAGARNILVNQSHGGKESFFCDTLKVMTSSIVRTLFTMRRKENTVIGVIATNAALTRDEAIRLAETASDGIALTIQPAFTMFDGDTVFSLSTGKKKLDINVLCAIAPFVFADAIISAVMHAEPLGGLPSAQEIIQTREREKWSK